MSDKLSMFVCGMHDFIKCSTLIWIVVHLSSKPLICTPPTQKTEEEKKRHMQKQAPVDSQMAEKKEKKNLAYRNVTQEHSWWGLLIDLETERRAWHTLAFMHTTNGSTLDAPVLWRSSSATSQQQMQMGFHVFPWVEIYGNNSLNGPGCPWPKQRNRKLS